MIKNISWGSYCYAVSISVVIYYAVIVIVFYRRELNSIFENLFKSGSSGTRMDTVHAELNGSQKATSWKEIGELPVRSVLDDLSVLIRKGAERAYPKEELLQSLKVKLNSCQDILGYEYKAAVNERIVADCKRYCSMHLDVEELEVLWFD